jgi:hypothetical protein
VIGPEPLEASASISSSRDGSQCAQSVENAIHADCGGRWPNLSLAFDCDDCMRDGGMGDILLGSGG